MDTPMEQVGPYRFTAHDAQRTISNFPTAWRQLAEGRDGSALDPLLPMLTADRPADLRAVWAAWCAAGPALRSSGQLPARQIGSVAQLNTGNGGVPKRPVPSVTVGWRGVDGDVQRSRMHHGRPWQALCLWSTEVIDAFRADGHPLAPGLAGENITVTGLDWASVRPGVRLQVGEVLCDVMAFAEPCKQNSAWFTGGDVRLMHESVGPVSRVYAMVVKTGRISVGDPAVLEP